jgi:hypothetical protein
MKQMSANTSYTAYIDAAGLNNDGLTTATLVDNVTGISTQLDLANRTGYTFTTTATEETGRLMIVLGRPVANTQPLTINNGNLQLSILGNPTKGNVIFQYAAKTAGKANVQLVDMGGKVLGSMDLGIQQHYCISYRSCTWHIPAETNGRQ